MDWKFSAMVVFGLILAICPAVAQELDADQRLIVGRDAYAPLPNGQVYTDHLSLNQEGSGFRFGDLDFYELAVVLVATDTADAPIIVTVSKEDAGGKKFRDQTDKRKALVFQTRLNGDLLVDLSPAVGQHAEGLLSVYLSEPVAPPLGDFTLGPDGTAFPAPGAPQEAQELEACVVDGGGSPATGTLGDNPSDRADQQARQKVFEDFKKKWTETIGLLGPMYGPVLNLMTSGVTAPAGLTKPDPSKLFGALAALPVAMFPDDQACNTALVQVDALPRVPVSCPWSMRQGTNCYGRAYEMIDHARLNLAKLACIHAAERKRFEILFAGMQGAANAAGALSPILNLKSQQIKKQWETTYLTVAKDKKVELMNDLRNGLIELGRCEADFGNFPGWYARVGFSYEATMNNIYDIK
jgi:hypothetical protein